MIEVLLADDHALVRKGLKHILNDSSDIRVKAEAKDGDEVIEIVSKEEFDIVVLDITMPKKNGIEVLKILRNLYPELPILILSMHSEEQYAIRMLKDGASGYLNKDAAPEELLIAIRKITSGRKYITYDVAEKLVDNLNKKETDYPHEILSAREFQIMNLIASGKSLTEISKELNISIKTVATYRARLMEKLNFKTNADLISYSVRHNLIS